MYGEFKNVLLSDEELNKLKSDYPSMWKVKLEALSNYMKSTGKKYKSHYATIKNWIQKDSEKGDYKLGNKEQRSGYESIEDFL